MNVTGDTVIIIQNALMTFTTQSSNKQDYSIQYTMYMGHGPMDTIVYSQSPINKAGVKIWVVRISEIPQFT